MSASQAAGLHAVTLQLVAALDEYEEEARALVAAWPDMERYARVSALVEQIRLFCAILPEMRVQWAELLIGHAELIHHLWRLQYGRGAQLHEQIAPRLEQHAEAIEALRRRCSRRPAR